MNRNELISHIAEETGLSKVDAGRALDAAIGGIVASLKSGDEVRLVGFGTFSVTTRSASEGRNPRTGEKIQLPESRQARFKPGKTLKDDLN